MFFQLPPTAETDEFFKRLRAILWGIFEAVLLVLAMVAIVLIALVHTNPPPPTRPAPTEPARVRGLPRTHLASESDSAGESRANCSGLAT